MTGPVKLTSIARHAIRAMVFLARHQDQRRVAVAQIANTLGLSITFLHKALNGMTKARIVHSLKGPRGGYRLAKPAKKITLLNVVEAMEGPIVGDVPLVGDDVGKGLDRRLQAIADRAAQNYRRLLGNVRIADLARH